MRGERGEPAGRHASILLQRLERPPAYIDINMYPATRRRARVF